METWNREELYAEVWEQPPVKVAPRYGNSAVAPGKVCQKLQIPLPGGGYWVIPGTVLGSKIYSLFD